MAKWMNECRSDWMIERVSESERITSIFIAINIFYYKTDNGRIAIQSQQVPIYIKTPRSNWC